MGFFKKKEIVIIEPIEPIVRLELMDLEEKNFSKFFKKVKEEINYQGSYDSDLDQKWNDRFNNLVMSKKEDKKPLAQSPNVTDEYYKKARTWFFSFAQSWDFKHEQKEVVCSALLRSMEGIDGVDK